MSVNKTKVSRRHAKRLLRLAAKLDTVPRKQFDISNWCSETECGTVACALGWAAHIPQFQALGLKAHVNPDSPELGRVTFRPVKKFDVSVMKAKGYHRDILHSFRAAEVFFGLDPFQTADLFDSHDNSRTPKQVARNIRRLVKKYHPDLVPARARRALAA